MRKTAIDKRKARYFREKYSAGEPVHSFDRGRIDEITEAKRRSINWDVVQDLATRIFLAVGISFFTVKLIILVGDQVASLAR